MERLRLLHFFPALPTIFDRTPWRLSNTASSVFLITLALQFLNVLFELLLFLVVSLGHFYKAIVCQFTRYIVLRELLSRVIQTK